MLCINALLNLAAQFKNSCQALFIGKGLRIDQFSRVIDEVNPAEIGSIEDLLDIRNHWRKADSVMQQSCFYPLKEVIKSGYLNVKNHYSMDYELWGRLLMAEIPIVRFNSDIGMFRWYQGQKTSDFNSATNSLVKTALSLVLINREFSVFKKISLIWKVAAYYVSYYYHFVRAEIGIKRRLKSSFNVGSDNLYK